MNVILFGMKGCGKTTFGRKLAKKLNRAFIDTDLLIEDFYELNRGKKLTSHQIYEEIGPAGFRFLESEVIQSLQDVQNSVVAVGGGAMMQIDNVEALKKTGLLIYLILDKETLKKRSLEGAELPAYLDPKDPERSFELLYSQRDDFYKRLGATELIITNMKEDVIVDTIYSLFFESQKKA